MKVEDFNFFVNTQMTAKTNSAKADGLFDMEFQISKMGPPGTVGGNLVTSKFACTPGCGHTGTGNSFCCTCR